VGTAWTASQPSSAVCPSLLGVLALPPLPRPAGGDALSSGRPVGRVSCASSRIGAATQPLCGTPLSSCSQTATHSLDDHLSLRQPLQRVRRATSHTAIRVHATRAVRDGEGANRVSMGRCRGGSEPSPQTRMRR
jgi:hypothetical protein